MRNKQQLGYYVSASRRQTRGVLGFLYVIESAEYDPLDLQERIFKFVNSIISKMKDNEYLFKEYLEGLIARKREGFKDMKEETSYYFGCMKEFNPQPQGI